MNNINLQELARRHYATLANAGDDAHCLVDQTGRSGDEFAADVIREAIAAGWDIAEAREVIARYEAEISSPEHASYSTWADSEDTSQALSELFWQAEDYLSLEIAPDGWTFANCGERGGFFFERDDA